MKTDLVVAGYIFHDGRVLLVHHKKLDLWLPVGGHIEKDETPDDALIREIKEETSLEVGIIGMKQSSSDGNVIKNLATPFHVNLHSAGDHRHCCFFYACRALNPKSLKINPELKDSGWFSEEDLNDKRVSPDVREIGLMAFEVMRNGRIG